MHKTKQGTGLSISRANSVITIDGVLDEEAGLQPSGRQFFSQLPGRFTSTFFSN
ncbi:MAG: hypothetical protein IPJ20_13650 [Flammeovirgaceae bacterium]|nr:hypothetical protein [Flammeovirgaceae bacterium]